MTRPKQSKTQLHILYELSTLYILPLNTIHCYTSGVRVTRSLVLYVCFIDRCLSFSFWPLCCLAFIDLIDESNTQLAHGAGVLVKLNSKLWKDKRRKL